MIILVMFTDKNQLQNLRYLEKQIFLDINGHLKTCTWNGNNNL